MNTNLPAPSCCPDPRPILAATTQVTLSTGEKYTLGISETICVRCGAIRGLVADKIATAQSALSALGKHAIGKKGTASSLGLPDWGAAEFDCVEPPISNRLLNDYKYRSTQDTISRIMIANGATKASLQLQVQSPIGVPSMTLSKEVVSHIVKNGKDHHVRYAPLIRDILEDPFEVWSRDVDDKLNQIHYLRKFVQSGREITMLVVGDQLDEFLRTAFLLRDRKQAQGKREGVLLYAKWANQ